MAHFLCHLGCSHFGALLLDFYFTENIIDRDMKKKEFRDYVGISYSTMSKLEKGENTTVEVLEKICLKLGCGIDDIMEILPDSPDNGTEQGVE